ncbi:uncharacterized protein LOC111468877 [Cucurbita maxima]|uniref:Uncharacterized protein LOC111468877 n=1 Tax=Cucurbita maxima TaxID=3661 RepID=A0A6J1I0W7_CUCMA|nr:uncharacterized protein LOC111468877 [Cucurbita maxima]
MINIQQYVKLPINSRGKRKTKGIGKAKESLTKEGSLLQRFNIEVPRQYNQNRGTSPRPITGKFNRHHRRHGQFRCGSLRRYGASVREFHLGVGVSLNPCAERIVIIRQNLGSNWSPIYFNNYHLIGYQLVSSILGLLAYNPGNYTNTSSSPVPFEVGISTGEKPITIDFRNSTRTGNVSGIRPICARFERDGRVTLAKEISPLVCSALRQGHFGLVEEAEPVELRKKERPWKVAVGSSIGAAIGAFLLGLLLVAMFVRVKQRTEMEEMEIRAYEEEALQVSMVGHVRAPTAPGARTLPSIENEYMPPSSRR